MILGNSNNNNNSEDRRLIWYMLRTAVAALILAGGAWASWVTTSINKHTDILADIKQSLARIEQRLEDHFREDTNRGGH